MVATYPLASRGRDLFHHARQCPAERSVAHQTQIHIQEPDESGLEFEIHRKARAVGLAVDSRFRGGTFRPLSTPASPAGPPPLLDIERWHQSFNRH